jgi:hypothetical protein
MQATSSFMDLSLGSPHGNGSGASGSWFSGGEFGEEGEEGAYPAANGQYPTSGGMGGGGSAQAILPRGCQESSTHR